MVIYTTETTKSVALEIADLQERLRIAKLKFRAVLGHQKTNIDRIARDVVESYIISNKLSVKECGKVWDAVSRAIRATLPQSELCFSETEFFVLPYAQWLDCYLTVEGIKTHFLNTIYAEYYFGNL